jgi:hypothetical protein
MICPLLNRFCMTSNINIFTLQTIQVKGIWNTTSTITIISIFLYGVQLKKLGCCRKLK